MEQKAIQDFYSDDVAQCYGCGRLNEHGNQIKTFWEGDETITRFTPKDYHIAIPGYVYGGLLASLIDCHGTATAALASYRFAGRELGSVPVFRFVTASLSVEYVKPTPLGVELELHGKVLELKGKKVVSEITLSANGIITVKGKVVAVNMLTI